MNERCFAHRRNGKCVALTGEQCAGYAVCAFYKPVWKHAQDVARADQRLNESVRYVYLTRIHIRSEMLADQRMQRLYGVPLLDSEGRGQFIAARCAMERFQTDYALRLSCSTEGGVARLDLEAAWSCA